ncbi:MAG: hypothetical protein H0V88_07185 [Pyrinomonadaceae bacterium]|nr:hypothetical protein [Pyrinomonadaceae bacterium]
MASLSGGLLSSKRTNSFYLHDDERQIVVLRRVTTPVADLSNDSFA